MAKRPPSLAFQDDAALLTPGATRDRLLQQMRRQGARDVRLNAIYGRIKAEGYGQYDEAVNAIRAAGLHPQMTIMGTPSYSPHWDQSLSAAHTNPALARAFAKEVTQHFKGRVGRYAAWNEPNWGGFISGADDNPKQAARRYRSLYRAMYSGIKSADKGAQVLLGEVTSSPNAKEFMKYLMAGKPLKTAGFAYHPYDQPGKPTTTWDIDTLGELQDQLATYKRQGKLQTAQGKQAPLYLTEFGYQRRDQSPQEHLRKLGRAYALAKQAGARQFLQYQVMPTAPNVWATPGQTVADAYGNQTTGPGGVAQAPSGAWDTGIADAQGNLPAINRGIRLSRTIRASAARKKR